MCRLAEPQSDTPAGERKIVSCLLCARRPQPSHSTPPQGHTPPSVRCRHSIGPPLGVPWARRTCSVLPLALFEPARWLVSLLKAIGVAVHQAPFALEPEDM